MRRAGATEDDAAAIGRVARRVDLARARIEEDLRRRAILQRQPCEAGAPLAALHEDGGAAVRRHVHLRGAQAAGDPAFASLVDAEEIAEGQVGVRYLPTREEDAATGERSDLAAAPEVVHLLVDAALPVNPPEPGPPVGAGLHVMELSAVARPPRPHGALAGKGADGRPGEGAARLDGRALGGDIPRR